MWDKSGNKLLPHKYERDYVYCSYNFGASAIYNSTSQLILRWINIVYLSVLGWCLCKRQEIVTLIRYIYYEIEKYVCHKILKSM